MSQKEKHVQKEQKRQDKQGFNDLLLPILGVICILPFVLRMAEYDYGYSKYPWHSSYSIVADIYTYYRSKVFAVIALICAVILPFRLSLYKEKTRSVKIFIPLAIYSIFAVLSTIFSMNLKASLSGNFYQFQNVFVLLGYGLVGFYTYQIVETERDYKCIQKGFLFTFFVSAVIGICQIFRHDLLDAPVVQRLIMNADQFAEYGGEVETAFSGNNVFLSLANPNYAATFLVMFAAIFAVLCFYGEDKKEKLLYGSCLAMCLILTWYTYTRGALVALCVCGIVLLCAKRDWTKKKIAIVVGIVGICVLGAILLDCFSGFKYLGRMVDHPMVNSIMSMETTPEGIHIETKDYSGVISFEHENSQNLPASIKITRDGGYYLISIDEYTFSFQKVRGQFLYETGNGNLVPLEKIEKVDFGGREYWGSGRLYIWSRVLPLLKKYIFVGSGPDTFAEVYPQQDYVGKTVYAKTDTRVMEGAHNDYLMHWVQTGMMSVLALLVFYGWYIKKCMRYLKKKSLKGLEEKLGFGCFLGCLGYMVCSLFSDGMLYTTPIFYILMGLSLNVIEDKACFHN